MLQIPVNFNELYKGKKRLQKHFWKKKWIAGFYLNDLAEQIEDQNNK